MRASLLLFLATALLAQPPMLTRLEPTGIAPSPRVDAPPVYDPGTRQLFIFGGQDPTGDVNDLWAYSVERNRWQRLDPPGDKPPARHGHTVTFDPVNRQIIVIAGQARGFFNDVWAYAIDANRWRRLSDGAGPSPRYAHSAVYDAATQRVILSHGFTSERGRFDDTWAFSLETNRWTEISPSGTRPLRRCLHHAAIDPASRRMYLYGGCASGFGPCPLGDLWEFDLATNRWTEVRTAGASPAARERFGLAFDGLRNRLVLHGGSGGGLLGDVWEFDPASSAWSRAEASGVGRWRLESAEAPELAAVFFFGGETGGALSNDLLRLSTVPLVNAFSSAAGPWARGGLYSLFVPHTAGAATLTVNGRAVTPLFSDGRQVNFQMPPVDGAVAEIVLEGSRLRVPLVRSAPGLWREVTMAEGLATIYLTGVNGEVKLRWRGEPVDVVELAEIATGVWAATFRASQPISIEEVEVGS